MSVNSFSGQPAIPTSYGFTAGKNKIINGDFGIWQRGTSFTNPGGSYTVDRFWAANNTGTIQQSTDVPTGFTYSLFNNTASTFATGTPIELMATGIALFTPSTSVTLSFYAKAASATSVKVDLYYRDSKFVSTNQSAFTGSGNSISVGTSWTRYTYTYTSSTPNSTNTVLGLEFTLGAGVKITGIQLEAGATATAFQTATGTIQGELAACQRYYEVLTAADINGICYTTANAYVTAPFKVTKRTDAITITYAASNTNLLYAVGSGYKSPTAVATETYDANALGFTATGFSTTSMAIGYPLRYTGSNIGISAEL